MTPASQRSGLWQHVDQRVTGEALLTRKRRTRRAIRDLTLLEAVCLDTGERFEHLFVEMPLITLRYLTPGKRFRFEAKVGVYRRKDGSRDVSLCEVRFTKPIRTLEQP